MIPVRCVVLFLALADSVLWVLVWRRCRIRQRARAVLMLTWTLQTLLFTVAAQCQWFAPEVLNVWSSITRAHGLIVTGVFAIDLLTAGEYDV